MARVLLINGNRCENPYAVYPLGVSYVAGALAAGGNTVEIVDVNVDGTDVRGRVARFRPDLVGLSIRNIDDCRIEDSRFYVPQAIELAKALRACTSAPLVIGGTGFSIFARRIMELTGAEYGVVGEGEAPAVALARALTNGHSLGRIPGLVYRDSGRIVINPSACESDGSGVPLRPPTLCGHYLRVSSMLNLQTQRGCPFRCCYCSYPLLEGTAFRCRRPREVAEEVERIVSLGARYFFVVDSVFNSSAAHVAGICEEILRRELAVKWGCFLRPRGLTKDLTALMARAGLTHVEFGSDSFSDRVLERYGKELTFSDIHESSELLRKAGIRYAHFLIVGGPGETEDTIREAHANSRRLRRTVVFPFVGMRMIPHTPLHRIAIDEGVVDRDDELFEPFFYVSPGIGRDGIDRLLRELAGEAGNWVIGEPPPAVIDIMAKLRAKGIPGPLWEYIAR